MDWKFLQAKFPWGMLLLVGGSFAMAQGIEVIFALGYYSLFISTWPS